MPVIYPPLDSWIWVIPAVMIGACIGSFLNVVIYRLPLGMSVNKPNRSFCPLCKNQLTMLQNMPVVSWLFLRGKCAHCSAPIPFRYILVEIVTAALFGAVWWVFSATPEVVIFLWVLMGLLVAITWIDAAHLIIPTNLTWAGSLIGLGACFAWPQISALAGFNETRLHGFYDGVFGWAFGFGGLWVVVELGKKAFGKKAMKFDKEVDWHLKEPEGDDDPMLFVIDGDEIPWWDIFSRDSDRLLVDATEVILDGEETGEGQLVIRATGIELSDGRSFELEKMVSLSGRARGAVVPREAMGMGDVHLLGMLGAFFGATGVFFSLFAASLFAIVAALVGRIGFGKQLPFGPFLALGGVAWMFGGWRIWQWYMSFVGM
ncbi:MAG: prepilin peptidase [Akkermansiaceae bacterium]|nr:prepilin peptidase [Akkermansiaceae bacterium]MDP4846538.1 prepilin peptidase [Akkermansiaceae bacterium]